MNVDRASRSIVLVFTIAFGVLAGTASADPFFDFHGYSYQQGNPDAIGTRVQVPTLLNVIQPDPIWPLDFQNHEYTVMVSDLVIADISMAGPIEVLTYEGGTIGLYEDPARDATWAANPPNAQVPATFVDGVPMLTGRFTEMAMIFNTSTGTGSVRGLIDWTGGTRLADLANPNGWTYFGGVSNHQGLGTPAGYDLAWDPQIYGPEPSTPVSTASWGRIKNLFTGKR